jgi:hypothetical protein
MKFRKSVNESVSEDVERGNLSEFLLVLVDLNSNVGLELLPSKQ